MLLPVCFIIPFLGLFPLSNINEKKPEQPVEVQRPKEEVEKKEGEVLPSSLEEHPKKSNALTHLRKNPHRFAVPYTHSQGRSRPIVDHDHATGNWLGKRDDLHERGLEFSVVYTSDIAGNPVGGFAPGGFTYTDNFAFGCLIETKKLIGWRDGYITISSLQRDGNSLSEQNIGNQFTVQQVYGGQTFHFYELSYEQRWNHDHISAKVGRISPGDEFATSPLYWLYMNNGIDGNPQSLPVNANFACYPNAVWGSRIKVDLPQEMHARAGVYQVTPNSRHGLNWDFYPSDGALVVAQYEWHPDFFKPAPSDQGNPVPADMSESSSSDTTKKKKPVPKGLTGHYWMGGFYSTAEYPQFNSSNQIPGAYALYWHADQMVYRVNPLHDEGLVLWSDYTLSPQQNISLIPFQANAGIVYTGLIPGRHNDFTILGASYGTFSKDYANLQQQNGNGYRTYELVYEAAYRINMTKYAYIQPDLQWVINPAGTSNIPNALVLGAQMGMIF